MSDREAAEIEKLRAEARQADLEARRIEADLSRPWFRRSAFLQSVVAGIVAVPLVWFYVTEVALPLNQIENLSLQRENEETSLELQKQKREADTLQAQLIADATSQEQDYLRQLNRLREEKEQLNAERQALQARLQTILAEQEVSAASRQAIEENYAALQSEIERKDGELTRLRSEVSEQTARVEDLGAAVSAEFSKLSAQLNVSPDIYSRSRALLIGVWDYSQGGHWDLPGAEADIRTVAEVLEGRGFEIRALENPTANEIRAALAEEIAQSSAGDRFVMYWVGHGMTATEDGRARGYFVPADCEPTSRAECLPMEIVNDTLERITAKSAAAFIDTSHANLVFAATRGLVIAPVSKNEPSGSREVIAATDSSGLAFDGGAEGGPFAIAIREGLAGGLADFNRDGVIRMQELYHFLVTEVARRTTGQQVPSYASLRPNRGEMLFFTKTD